MKFLVRDKKLFSMVKSLPELLPETSPSVFVLETRKADQEELKGSNFHSQSTTWTLPGTGRDADEGHSPSLHWDMQVTSGDRAVSKGSQLAAKAVQPLKQLARDQSQELSYRKDLWWSWNTRSVMRACYSSNPRAQRERDFLRNWFTEVLNWRQAKIQSI